MTEDDRLVGMITDRDITTRVVAEGAVPETMSVGDVQADIALKENEKRTGQLIGAIPER